MVHELCVRVSDKETKDRKTGATGEGFGGGGQREERVVGRKELLNRKLCSR